MIHAFTRSFKHLVLLPMVCLSMGLAGASFAASAPEPIGAALQDTLRPKTDSERDAVRHPAELLKFAGIQPGQYVVDLLPGGGYFTRLFSKVVGSQGQVYALVPAPHDKLSPKFSEMLKKGYGNMQEMAKSYTNLTALSQGLDQLAIPVPVDLVWTAQNYHDIYGYWGAEVMAKTNKAVFDALKPGGIYLVIDHVGTPGDDLKAATTLHRIDPETVKKQVQAAGFVFDGESKVLHNPKDDYTISVFDPKLRGHTDQFVFRFKKP